MVQKRRVPPAEPTILPFPAAVLRDVMAHYVKDIVIVTDAAIDEPGPRMLYVNNRFTELTGYAPEDVIGRSPRMLQGEGTDRAALKRVRQAMKKGLPVTERVTNYGRDGAPLEIEMRIVPFADAAGEVTHYVSVQRDLTPELQRRVARERVEMLLGTVVNAVDFGLLVLDEDRRCVIANQPLLSLLGKRANEVIGAYLGTLFPEMDETSIDDAPVGTRQIVRAGKRSQRLRVELELLRGLSGSKQFKALRVSPAPPANDRAPGKVVNGRGTIVGGQFHFVGLEAVREALGEQWRERAETVFGLAQAVLERRLGLRDVWQRSEDDGFIVAFHDLDERTARFRAAAIAEEITLTLIGSGTSDVACVSRTVRIDAPDADDASPTAAQAKRSTRPPEAEASDILGHVRRNIDESAGSFEQRVRRQLASTFERPRIHLDEVVLLRAGHSIADRLRFDSDLESELLAVRETFADATDVLLESTSCLLGHAIKILSEEATAVTQPLILPMDPILMDSRRTWSQLLDLARRIPSALRKRIIPLIDGANPDLSPYRISDMATTLTQLFSRPGLIHPPRGALRYNPERCRIRMVVFRADDLPPKGGDDKHLARLHTEVRMNRVAIGIDEVRRHEHTARHYPAHDVIIRAAA